MIHEGCWYYKKGQEMSLASDRPQYCARNWLVGEVLNIICRYENDITIFAANRCGNHNNPSAQTDIFGSAQ